MLFLSNMIMSTTVNAKCKGMTRMIIEFLILRTRMTRIHQLMYDKTACRTETLNVFKSLKFRGCRRGEPKYSTGKVVGNWGNWEVVRDRNSIKRMRRDNQLSTIMRTGLRPYPAWRMCTQNATTLTRPLQAETMIYGKIILHHKLIKGKVKKKMSTKE